MSHIACLDESDAEDEPGLVEEGARSPSLILNSLHLNLQSATLTALYAEALQPVFRMGKDTLISCLISYLISSLISYMKICDMRSDIIDL